VDGELATDGGYAWTYGRERPGTVIGLRYKAETIRVTANDEGWWMCIRETPEGDWEIPTRLE
jgi:hypothetical protein